MAFDESVKLIWSLANSGPATTITTAGNSGGFSVTQTNLKSAVDLRRVDDVWLSVIVTGTIGGTGSPSLSVTLGAFDDAGNLFGGLLTAGPLTANGTAGAKVAFGGRHGGGGAGSYFVLPEFGQVAWTVTGTGPSFPGVDIALYAR